MSALLDAFPQARDAQQRQQRATQDAIVATLEKLAEVRQQARTGGVCGCMQASCAHWS